MSESRGDRWWDLIKILGPTLLGLLPPAATIYALGRDLLTTAYQIPGWALVVSATVFGAFLVISWYQVRRWLRTRRTRFLLIEHSGPYALRWALEDRGDYEAMLLLGPFIITNPNLGEVSVARIGLTIRSKRWRVVPSHHYTEGSGISGPLRPGATNVQLNWSLSPATHCQGDVVTGRVSLFDNYGHETRTRWLRFLSAAE